MMGCMADDAAFISPEVLATIRSRANRFDQSGEWPVEDLDLLAGTGATRWAVGREFGGDDLSALEIHLRYEELASASLSDALILSQRDSAIGLIEGGEGGELRKEVVPKLARSEAFATVGIAQLTTSRQGGRPALTATREGDGYRIDGIIPWATGAAEAEWIVAGAQVDDGRQILFVLRTRDGGVEVQPPAHLVALRSTWTASVICSDVLVKENAIIHGPTDRALAIRKRSLPIGQSFLALGLCRRALELIVAHTSDAAQLAHERFARQLLWIRREVLELSQPGREGEASAQSPRIRGACNDLAVRITHAAIALYKGAALLADHPAQRLAREAMFLLVWSCPSPVIDCTVDLLTQS